MPDVTATIDRHQRDGLYELIRNHLGSVGDLWRALEDEKDFAKAERLGHQFAEDIRLLADIGWEVEDDRESFELTMPPQELTPALMRLHDEAAAVLSGSEGRARLARRRCGGRSPLPVRPRRLRGSARRHRPRGRVGVSAAKKNKRLRPGELDGLVLAHMRKRKDDAPLTASAIGKGIGRSSGAVANCLARLTKDKRVRQAKRKPRAYALKEAK
jgi:hypothetical protein